MSEDSFKVGTPMFSLGLSRKEHILEIEEGKIYLIRSWNWRKMGFIHKVMYLKDGELMVRGEKEWQ